MKNLIRRLLGKAESGTGDSRKEGNSGSGEKRKKPLASPSPKVPGFDKVFPGEEMRAFFTELGIEYVRKTKFSDACAIFRKTKLKDYAEYGKKGRITPEQFKEFSRLLREGYQAPIYVKWTNDDVGYGLFAAEDIPEGGFLGEYTGLVVPKGDVKNRTWSWKYPIRGHFIDSFPAKVSLDACDYGNELRFANHGDERNSSPVQVHDGTTWLNCYFASKPIAKDEEILVTYGERYWKTRTKIPL